jgi:hypothetical protein
MTMKVAILLKKNRQISQENYSFFFAEIIVCWQNVIIWWNKWQNMENPYVEECNFSITNAY